MRKTDTNVSEIQKKIDEVTNSVKVLSELHNTLIDQVTELNLLLASEKKSVYEKLLFQFDEDVAKMLADDILNELSNREKRND